MEVNAASGVVNAVADGETNTLSMHDVVHLLGEGGMKEEKEVLIGNENENEKRGSRCKGMLHTSFSIPGVFGWVGDAWCTPSQPQ